MPRYKRTFDEAELGDVSSPALLQPENEETLTRLRNMWEFASLMQYIFLFGSVVKIGDDFDIEDLETECLKPQPSEKLAHIGLQLLKYVSSHRGLTPDLFNEYTRRQYVAKAPLRNPFGDEEEPASFNDFDVFTKIKILQQLSTWTLGNADRIRGMMSQEEDQLNWRIEPVGWDKDDRAYFVLDDDRLYRREDEPLPPPTPPVQKAKVVKKKGSKGMKPKVRGTRASKRRKIEDDSDAEDEGDVKEEDVVAEDDTVMTNGDHPSRPAEEEEPGYGFTSKTWSCIAITLDDYQDFLATIFRSRDPNEKQLRRMIEENVLPIIEKRAEAQRAKAARKMREIENLAKLATAKRSSRLADKADREAKEREEKEAEEKLKAERRMAHEEQERQRRIEEGHESRRLTREQRLKEREVKRILHEEELAKIQEREARGESADPGSDAAAANGNDANGHRMSERQLKTAKERHERELAEMQDDEDTWIFDCAKCGIHGENLDDGTHSIACERCNVWQHSKCHGFSPKQAEKDGFHFVCGTCKRKERREKAEKEEAARPKIPPLKLGKKGGVGGSPEGQKTKKSPMANGTSHHVLPNGLPEHIQRQLDAPAHPTLPQPPQQQHHFQYYYPSPAGGPAVGPFSGPQQMQNGAGYSPSYGQAQGYRYPPVGSFAPQPPPPQAQHTQAWQHGQHQVPPPSARPGSSGYANSPPGPSARPPSAGYATSPPLPPRMANGYQNPSPGQQHQQQHQYVHQTAVAQSGATGAAGAHPRFAAPIYSLNRGHGGPGGSPTYPQQQQQGQAGWNQQYRQSQSPAGYGVGAHSGQHSPVKVAPKPPAASPPAPSQQQQQHYPPQQPNQGIARSPSANFPPPAYPQQGAQSPVKSSPSPAQGHGFGQGQQRMPAQSPTPQPGPSPSSQALRPFVAGPEQSTQSASTSSASAAAYLNATGSRTAVDGMSGPWPSGSQAIPQKPPQPPAAPSPAQILTLQEAPVPPVAPRSDHRAPHQQESNTSPAPASASANGMAADGMAGPWPESSKCIPQKQDQAPAAPSPSQGFHEPSRPTVAPTTDFSASSQQQQKSSPAPADANANGIATDGMAGPWPESSSAIPQKKDLATERDVATTLLAGGNVGEDGEATASPAVDPPRLVPNAVWEDFKAATGAEEISGRPPLMMNQDLRMGQEMTKEKLGTPSVLQKSDNDGGKASVMNGSDLAPAAGAEGLDGGEARPVSSTNGVDVSAGHTDGSQGRVE